MAAKRRSEGTREMKWNATKQNKIVNITSSMKSCTQKSGCNLWDQSKNREHSSGHKCVQVVRLIYSSILLKGTTTILLTVLHIVIAVGVNVGASLSLVDASPMTDVSVLCQRDYRLYLNTCFISVCVCVCVCVCMHTSIGRFHQLCIM